VQLKKADLMREYSEGTSILRKQEATTNASEHDNQPEEGVVMNEDHQEEAPQEQSQQKEEDEGDEGQDGGNGGGDDVPRPLRD
jgi:hypothetical protein